MIDNKRRINGEASTSLLTRSLRHRPVLSGKTLRSPAPVLVLQDPGEEDHHVLDVSQLQSLSLLLPARAHHCM